MNILILVIDSLRPDYCGYAGHPTVRTPHLDALAAEGAVLERAYAEYPLTVPWRTAAVSGCYTFTNRPWTPLRPYDHHIAELLRAAGYRTAAFSDTPFNAETGMDRGFDEFEYLPVGKCHPPADPSFECEVRPAYFPPGADVERQFYRNTMRNRAYALEHYGAACPELLFDRAIGWLRRHGSERFLLWVDSFGVHEPWIAPPPYEGMYGSTAHQRYIPMPASDPAAWARPGDLEHLRALYAEEVTHLDAEVGRLLAEVEELGLRGNTLVVVISDHGCPLGEHGRVRKFGVPMYDQLLRMLWIMRLPSVIRPGTRLTGLVQNTDLAPTLLRWLDLPLPQRQGLSASDDVREFPPMDGVNLLPLLRGEAQAVRESAFCGGFGLSGAVVTERWKFVDHRGAEPNELFDLTDDPGESVNRLPEQPGVGAELHRRLFEFGKRWSAALTWAGL